MHGSAMNGSDSDGGLRRSSSLQPEETVDRAGAATGRPVGQIAVVVPPPRPKRPAGRYPEDAQRAGVADGGGSADLQTGKANDGATTSPEATAARGAEEKGIRSAIERWQANYRRVNLRGLVGCYAPVVETYFGQKNLKPSQVEREKQREWKDIARIRYYAARPLSIADGGRGQKVAMVEKDWDETTRWGTVFAGRDVERIVFAKVNGGWRIVKEEEVKVLKRRG